jgi:uncharacterized membrane protein YtjA (UPF0391 family)
VRLSDVLPHGETCAGGNKVGKADFDPPSGKYQPKEFNAMLYWAAVFFIIALVAGVLGFTGIAFASADIARILFFVFLVLFLVSLVSHAGRRT